MIIINFSNKSAIFHMESEDLAKIFEKYKDFEKHINHLIRTKDSQGVIQLITELIYLSYKGKDGRDSFALSDEFTQLFDILTHDPYRLELFTNGIIYVPEDGNPNLWMTMDLICDGGELS